MFPKTPIFSPESSGSYTPAVIKQQEMKPVFIFPDNIEQNRIDEDENEENDFVQGLKINCLPLVRQKVSSLQKTKKLKTKKVNRFRQR